MTLLEGPSEPPTLGDVWIAAVLGVPLSVAIVFAMEALFG